MLSTVTLIRDSQKFILPHFKMYEGLKNFGLLVDNSIIGGAVGHQISDNSESLVKDFFPDTVISHTGNNVWGSDIFNEMISLTDQAPETRARKKSEKMGIERIDFIFDDRADLFPNNIVSLNILKFIKKGIL